MAYTESWSLGQPQVKRVLARVAERSGRRRPGSQAPDADACLTFRTSPDAFARNVAGGGAGEAVALRKAEQAKHLLGARGTGGEADWWPSARWIG